MRTATRYETKNTLGTFDDPSSWTKLSDIRMYIN